MFEDTLALAILTSSGIAAALVTGLAVWVIGRPIARRNRKLATLVCALVAPALTTVVGVILFRIDSARYPQSDGPPMALSGTLMIAMLMMAVTIPIAGWTLRSEGTRR